MDLTFHGETVHFVTTHLESISPVVNELQAEELLAGPAVSSFPTVVAGDFNSPAGGTGGAYSVFASPTTGFVDAWETIHPNLPGFTDAPATLPQSPTVQFDGTRIDFIWVRGGTVLTATEPGFRPGDREPLDVWPSNHRAVVSVVRF